MRCKRIGEEITPDFCAKRQAYNNGQCASCNQPDRPEPATLERYDPRRHRFLGRTRRDPLVRPGA